MKIMTNLTEMPNPGSDDAVDLGCTCPILDNGHGKGSAWGEGVFWYSVDCPVHSRTSTIKVGGSENRDGED